MLKLSILDQSPIRKGLNGGDALRETTKLAQLADRLGYTRFWIAEHHNSKGMASSAPEIAITHVAANTKEITVGSGGVLLSHYSSYKVAETFSMLASLHPGRIDLGIGRAPGSDQLTAMALQHGPGALGIEHFPSQIRDLNGFIQGEMPDDHPFARVRARPRPDVPPEVWLLGSSDQSAAYAAHFGMPFSFAHFINPRGGPEVAEGYRHHFTPSTFLSSPKVNIGIFAVCADTEEEADALATTRDLWMLRLRKGETGPVPTVEEAASYPYTEAEREMMKAARARISFGTPDKVKAEITALAEAYGTDEVVILTITPEFEQRTRSYALLAEAFGLAPRDI